MTENIYIPPGQNASPSQVTPQLSPVPICSPGWSEAIMIECLAQGHKCRAEPGFEPTFCKLQNFSPPP